LGDGVEDVVRAEDEIEGAVAEAAEVTHVVGVDLELGE